MKPGLLSMTASAVCWVMRCTARSGCTPNTAAWYRSWRPGITSASCCRSLLKQLIYRRLKKMISPVWRIPPGLVWWGPCWSGLPPVAAWHGPGGCRRSLFTTWKATCWHRCWRLIRRNSRFWHYWSRAAIPCWSKWAGWVTTGCWAIPLMMPWARPLTRPRACWVCPIPAARRWRLWRCRAIPHASPSRVP